MRKLILWLVFLFLIKIASADIVLTEVMYNPTQASDTDLEWIEIYNNGTESVDLSSWKIDGNNFEDFLILSGEFVVIARELVDGTDTDLDSFESVYGNGDSIWNSSDENFRAFDGDFSLTDIDLVNLTDGVYFEVLEYNSSFGGNGNGFSIEKIDVNKENTFDNWKESSISGGSPGWGNVVKEGASVLSVDVEITGTKPLLSLINITDDSNDNGVQIRPKLNSNKSIVVNVLVNSSLGIGNVSKLTGELNGNLVEFTRAYDLDSVSGIFNGNLEIEYNRANQTGPKLSDVRLGEKVEDSKKGLENFLKENTFLVEVKKRRHIYFAKNVKVHLDIEVNGLEGPFLEIEAIDSDGKLGVETIKKQCEEYQNLFGIKSEQLISDSYSDMLLAKEKR